MNARHRHALFTVAVIRGLLLHVVLVVVRMLDPLQQGLDLLKGQFERGGGSVRRSVQGRLQRFRRIVRAVLESFVVRTLNRRVVGPGRKLALQYLSVVVVVGIRNGGIRHGRQDVGNDLAKVGCCRLCTRASYSGGRAAPMPSDLLVVVEC